MEVKAGGNSYKVAEDVLYIKSHQWMKLEGSMALIGITDYAQSQLGEISLVDLNAVEIGQKVLQAKFKGNDPESSPIPDISIESSKTVVDMFSPVSGTIEVVNKSLEDKPEKVNQDPFGSWIMKIKPSDYEGEKGNLLDAKAYAEFIKTL